jgi:hypothetical protein
VKRGADRIEPTPLCAIFGQGHQHFLSRLGAISGRVQSSNVADLSRVLFEQWKYDDDTEGFRGDAVEDRRYADQFGDPSDDRNNIGSVTGANRIATLGFPLFTGGSFHTSCSLSSAASSHF